jgi:cell wall-associated NlpC family hydrolase
MRLIVLGVVALALTAPAPAQASTAVVDVSVATLWKAPNLARSLDAPSLGNPVDPRAWSSNLSTTESRVWLDSHVQTQALYGQQVVVLERRAGWAKVAVVDEPDPQDPRGYPGWLPARQLVFGQLPDLAAHFAVVVAPSVHLNGNGLEVSFATRLPVVRTDAQRVVVRTPSGDEAWVPRTSVRIVSPDGRRPTGAEAVATARRFLGVHYLWGGLSSWGFDCSGLVWAVYRSYGATIPRDADPQFRHGRRVAPNALRPGDLVFYGSDRYVHHVAIYAGGGRMLEAPDSAHRVRLVPMRWREFAGARRY